jgi:hypothetical protein
VSQPSSPSPLSQQDQDALVKQIGIALIRSAPQDWRHIDADFRAVGRHFELSSRALDASGDELPWTPAQDTAMVFARLRAGMHGENGGTWFNAHYTVEHPSSYNLEFDRNEPEWNTPPPPQAYRDELRYFPRREEHVPEWLMRRLAGLRRERPERKFRIARIFDRPGPDGRPTVERPEVDPSEKDRLLTYLERSTMILPMRGRDLDRLATDGRQSVPVAFHSDGTWIWPAAVGYYLRNHDIPPEPGLLEHARENGFAPAEIEEQTAGAAAANITGGRPTPTPPQPERTPEPREAGPETPLAADQEAALPAVGAGMVAAESQTEAPPEPEEEAAEAEHRDEASEPDLALEPPPVVSDARSEPHEENQPGEPPAEPATAPDRDEAVLTRLRETLDGLGIPETAYCIGEPTEPRSWYLEWVPDGWQVGWYEREFATPMLFDDAPDAAAFLLGKLMLDAADAERHGASGTEVDGHERRHAPARAAQEQQDAHRHEPAAEAHAADTARDGDAPAPEWSILPLPGEPPLTLFHKKRIVELPAGAEIDRHGEPVGNLGYQVGTPFPERSLPPDWELREYHVYRLQQPVVVLAGEAIPWFEQPGGGLAYLLTNSVQELLDAGDLAEVVLEDQRRG